MMFLELHEVVKRPNLRARMRSAPTALLDLVEMEAEFTPGALTLSDVCRDPKDEPFLACAVEGKATHLVTDDAQVLDMEIYDGVMLIHVVDCVRLLEKG
ncbi:MAG: putative toxin-antitoxin system toxin component, PIN family [Caldilineaceae bacterium]|nr:putative toxin-antitoxin system toxin component, PIN family [Caldilineaceae bacterium]